MSSETSKEDTPRRISKPPHPSVRIRSEPPELISHGSPLSPPADLQHGPSLSPRESIIRDNNLHGKFADREKTTDGSESSSDPPKNIQKPIPSDSSHTLKLHARLEWIPANWTWSKWKPVIRSALAAWLSVVIFVIPRTENLMGQASFLIIIASFLSPPSDPFIAVLERELVILSFVCIGWGWSCLGLKLANLARKNTDPTASLTSIITGQYIEAAPTIIMAIFIFLGSAAFLFVKARQGPGPFLFACVFGCICIDISLTTAALFPYPYYTIGQVIAIPLAFHSAIVLILSILLFPTSVSTLFTSRLQGALVPLATAIRLHRALLKLPVDSPDFSSSKITASVNNAEAALGPIAAAARLLKVDIIYSRYAPTDYSEIHKIARRLTVRANGMGVYYSLIDPTRERFPVTPATSRPVTPMTGTPAQSRPPSPERSPPSSPQEKHPHNLHSHGHDLSSESRHLHSHHLRSLSHHAEPTSPLHSRHHRSHSKFYRHSHSPSHSHHNILHGHGSLLHLALSHIPKPEFAVGVFESQRYLNLEATHMAHPESERFTAQATELLSESCQDLLGCCENGLQGAQDWLGRCRDHRWRFWMSDQQKDKLIGEAAQKYGKLHGELSKALEDFQETKRHKVLDPYRSIFEGDDGDGAGKGDHEVPPHRYLFHCYVFQYHLMEFARLTQSMLAEIIRLEKTRTRSRLWTPALSLSFSKLVSWSPWQASEVLERDDDENPEMIPGIDPEWMSDLGQAVRRDPDALPPRNAFEAAMNTIYRMFIVLSGGNSLYALKAGALTVILCLPSFLKSSASFAYHNKFVWAVFMGQLTIARFRGDTTFGLVARITSTFCGGIIGTLMWYISTGSGRGNPFGLAAVCAVCFPFFFFARLYWPVPPMTNLILFVTSALVIGYSYQDTHLTIPSSPGWGIDVAWRRFVLVTIGVVAAGIFSFFPPSTTIRSYQRRTLATTAAELGAIYCSVVSFANTQKDADVQLIVQSLLAIRSKLNRSVILKANVVYEFSLRGKWPAERYQKILEIQLEVAYLLSHLMSVVEHLDSAWSHAFLRRTRMLDSDFQGDVLAVISMISTALRTGSPLPQITPCPLLDRFMVRHHGLNVVHEESEDDYGLPRTLTLDTLENIQYLIFCVGASTAFGIVTRLDRLMVAVKELVGEQYHIHGVGAGQQSSRPLAA
ncbi:hypothetical protein BJ138DRAFT_1130340 [Hygrophoropsis aurantiaca]|uniref:Uncharacterized protein n=1 Tax=Hygrophoropsis aurantiaca TaxID=72124 RepID=A0ACB7ZX56_9AGAM|nr:hypothetical protein BJ138DRAFT_1130340 [Hygrophoropsis aurantiaca]